MWNLRSYYSGLLFFVMMTMSFVVQSVTVRGGRFLEAPLVGTLLQEQDNERQLPMVLTAGDFSLYEDCVPYFDSFTKKNFYLGNSCTKEFRPN